ncbi:MAG: hypothetical protein AB7N71_03910 [Phycisphaerae bacterium]
MIRIQRFSAIFAGCMMLATVAAAGTFQSAVVGFNGPPIDDPGTSQEMFRQPEFSGTTAAYILLNTPATFDNNAAYRASGLQTEGAGAMEIFFRWVDPADSDSWVRVTTFNGPVTPNPALHTQGKVRFNITNRSQLFQGRVGICLGIRESGVEVPQLADGGTTGEIEWVGVSTVPNGIIAGADGIVDTTAAGDDIQEYALGTDIVALELPAGTAVISPGPNGVINTVPAGDDALRSGYVVTADGGRRPVPQVFLPPSASPVALEFDLATGNVRVNGGNMGGGYAGFTGNGLMDLVPQRGTLEHIAFVNDTLDNAVLIDVGIDALQFESPEPEPVIPPRVVAPIIAGDTMITVTDLLPTVDQVILYRDGNVIATMNVANNNDVVFTVAPAMTDEVYTAAQRDMVTGITSNQSEGVTVLPEASPYSFSFILDEDGNDCSFTAPGGWEIMGASSLVSGPGIFIFPQGRTIFPNSAIWQTVEFRYDDNDNTTAWLGGNGEVSESPTGLYGMDTIWLTRQAGASDGPYEVLMDTIQVLDDADNVLITIDDFEEGPVRFTNTRGQSSSVDTDAGRTTDGYYSGTSSQRLVWSFLTAPGAADDRASFGQLSRVGFGECATAYQWDATVGTKVRFHMVFRSLSSSVLPLPEVVAPLLSSNTSVSVNADAAATSVQLYINGAAAGAPVAPVAGVATIMGVTLNDGDSVSAKQVIGGEESDFAYPKTVQTMLSPPPAPTLESPIQTIDNSVDVSGITPDVDMIQIVDAAEMVIGSTSSINPDGTATVALNRTLNAREIIRARASNVAGATDSPGFEVGAGNGDIYICLGIRETADMGGLGTVGGTTGPIEWLGASTTVSGAPVGVPVSPSMDWQTLTFTPGVDPVISFASGDGMLGSANGRGTLEHLAVTVNDTSANRSSGTYRIFVDNVINIGADGGNDFVIADFESFGIGEESLFQEPTFSGTTAGNLLFPPSASETTDAEGNPGQSELLTFFFVDTAPGRWVRITTSGATNLSRPVIDLTRPIQLDILMLPLAAVGCQGTCGDSNCDGVVSVSDIGFFVTAVAQGEAAWNAAFPGGTAPCDFCVNDINGDDFVTVSDIGGFVNAVINGACQ